MALRIRPYEPYLHLLLNPAYGGVEGVPYVDTDLDIVTVLAKVLYDLAATLSTEAVAQEAVEHFRRKDQDAAREGFDLLLHFPEPFQSAFRLAGFPLLKPLQVRQFAHPKG